MCQMPTVLVELPLLIRHVQLMAVVYCWLAYAEVDLMPEAAVVIAVCGLTQVRRHSIIEVM